VVVVEGVVAAHVVAARLLEATPSRLQERGAMQPARHIPLP
jgi:hypothetical protein